MQREVGSTEVTHPEVPYTMFALFNPHRIRSQNNLVFLSFFPLLSFLCFFASASTNYGPLQTVKGVSGAAPSLETDSEERLLIHISFSPRR